jgi:hypothetical protein
MLASKKPCLGKYLALRMQVRREEEFVMSFDLCFPNMAKLKSSISRKLKGKVVDLDLPLFWMLWTKKKVHWPKFFYDRMMKEANNPIDKPLLYCSLVGLVLKSNGLLERMRLMEPGYDNGSRCKVHA